MQRSSMAELKRQCVDAKISLGELRMILERRDQDLRDCNKKFAELFANYETLQRSYAYLKKHLDILNEVVQLARS